MTGGRSWLRRLDERGQALLSAPPGERRIAVVSLRQYATAAEAITLLPADVRTVRVQIRVQGQTPLEVEVHEDLAADVAHAVEAERTRLEDEAEELRRLFDSGTVDDAEFEETYEREREHCSDVLELLADGAGTVFAIVVEGPVA